MLWLLFVKLDDFADGALSPPLVPFTGLAKDLLVASLATGEILSAISASS